MLFNHLIHWSKHLIEVENYSKYLFETLQFLCQQKVFLLI